jgi:hypothetical protein
MEMSQGHSLYSNFKQTKMSFLFSYKNRELEGRTGPFWYSGMGEEVRKGCGKVNMVQILHTHICTWKNETC